MPAQDHLNELRTFIAGVSRVSNKTNPLELARTALSLLQTFPATRNAVLEYLCTLFDSAVAKYINQIESESESSNVASSGNEDTTITEIHNVLGSLVQENPEAWAPIISTWSLELLGELSSRYAGRAGVTSTSPLNDMLQLWMSCLATRTLVDVTTQCLACHRDSQACINALLDTSLVHGTHFDWVVAHVGSCFPRTVVTRVLRRGLEDFAQLDGAEDQHKLRSVVGILGHLAAGGHFHEIRQAFLQLFKASVEVENTAVSEREATVPFLLRLASLSSVLLSAITLDVLETLDGTMLERLRLVAPAWCRYLGSRAALASLLVSLALAVNRSGSQIVLLLLDAASPEPSKRGLIHPDIQDAAREILEMLLQELSQTLLSSATVSIPLLISVRREMAAVQPLLLSSDPLRLYTAVRLVGLVGYHSPADAVTAAKFLLLNAATADHLAALVRLGGTLTAEQLAQAVQQAMRCQDRTARDTGYKCRLWQNLATLLRWESGGRMVALSFSGALYSNLRESCSLMGRCDVPLLAHWVARVVDLAVGGDSLRRAGVEVCLRLTSATLDYFFLCVQQPAGLARTRGVNVCYRLLERISSRSPAARSFAIGELTRRALFGREARHFGAAPPPGADKQVKEQRLMDDIHKLGSGNMLAHRMSSTFLTASLDARRNASTQSCQLRSDDTGNTQMLIDAIKACSFDTIGDSGVRVMSLDAVTMLSLTLVELISSDRMYNGLPWPEEEFCKVTVERDLGMRRVLDTVPLSWSLLGLVSAHPPCLCYCSVILRAACATLLAQWSSSAHHDAPALLGTTQRLLEAMALGQLLPQPLAAMRDVVPRLKPVEIMHLLRACVWNYMRDNVPSPALFSRDPSSGVTWRADPAPPARHHTDTLRFIMQANIATLGSLFSQLYAADKS